MTRYSSHSSIPQSAGTPARRSLALGIALALCVAGTTLTASLPSFADSSHQPAITEVRADGGMLRIVGFDLGGGTLRVTLGGLSLSIASATATQIDALLPAGISPGSYLLTLAVGKGNTNDDGSKYDEFWVTIGAAGPQGPAGTTGLQGAIGPMGPQGIQGVAGPAGNDGAAGAQGPSGAQGVPGPAGPTGAGGALTSFEALAGLACNIANTGNACQGVTAVTFDSTTNGLGLICQPPALKPTLSFSFGFHIQPGQVVDVTTNPYKISRFHIAWNGNGGESATTCPGEVIVFTVFLHGEAQVQPPRSISVSGGSCSNVTVAPNTSVECTVTMNGNQSVRAS